MSKKLYDIEGDGNYKKSADGAIINTNRSAIMAAKRAKEIRIKRDDKLNIIIEKLNKIEKLLENVNFR